MGTECIFLDVKCFLLREISEQQSSLSSSYASSSFNVSFDEEGVGESVEMNNDSIYGKLEFHNATNIIIHENVTSTSHHHHNEDTSDIEIADLILVVLFCLLIVVTIIGNTLVILSIITTRRLRTVTNCFVMSLALADWLVGVFVLPPAVYTHYMKDAWHLGWILCDIWISLDVLLCTASILSLCAISIDRYLAVTQPLNYSRRRRSKRLALYMIFIVWILALAITCPPILGWYEQGRREPTQRECRYNQNPGYVVFSAMGSFFIPMLVMVYVYLRISCVVANRHDDMVQIKVHQNSARTREICVNDFECESDNENRGSCRQHQQQNSRPADQSVTTSILSSQRGSPILPNQDLVKKIEKMRQDESRNGHYELVHIGKIPSEPNLKLNSAAIKVKDCKHCREKSIQEQGQPTQTSSLVNINGAGSNNNNSTDHTNGSQQSGNNFNFLRSRTQAKSLSTRISSLKRESKTTRTLSIVMFVFIGCWLPFFLHYLLVPFYPDLKIPLLGRLITWLGWINSCLNPFIYAAYSEDFRAAFYRLTLRKICISTKKKPYGYPLAAKPLTSMSRR